MLPKLAAKLANGKPTIDDVARAAGVFKATVSRCLNPGAKQLSPEIATRVANAIRELGYRPIQWHRRSSAGARI